MPRALSISVLVHPSLCDHLHQFTYLSQQYRSQLHISIYIFSQTIDSWMRSLRWRNFMAPLHSPPMDRKTSLPTLYPQIHQDSAVGGLCSITPSLSSLHSLLLPTSVHYWSGSSIRSIPALPRAPTSKQAYRLPTRPASFRSRLIS